MPSTTDKNDNYITCAYSNLRSVRNKTLELSVLIALGNIDMFVATESWLTNKDPNALFSSINYKIVRRDRGSRGGGILFLIKNNISLKLIQSDPVYEILAIDFSFGKKLISYLPLHTSSKGKYFEKLFKAAKRTAKI